MSIPHNQVLEIRSRRPDGRDEVGSGFLLLPRLALTAAHVVFGESGKVGGPVRVQLARGTEPGEFAQAKVVWPSRPGKLDAALLEITDSTWHPPERIQTVRWGAITGSATEVRCTANGFPRVRKEPGTERDTEQLSGDINPGDQLRGRRYDVNLTSSVPDSPSLWSGMSGAALFAGDSLIGVVISVAPGFGAGKLTAEPASRMAADPAFVATMREHDASWELESVELADIFESPRRQSSSQSRASMLDAAAEVVPFRGREQILHELRSWCRASDDFITGLIVGPGGQGKTRLARELCRRLRSEGWVAGFVYERVSDAATGHLADTALPVLLVVDLAETRGAQITSLADVARRRRAGAPPIRLLMLARSAGDWWDQLCRLMSDIKATATCVTLPELEGSNTGRLNAYQEALRAFADRLTDADPGVRWQDVMAQLPQPDVSDAATASVLTLHMRALTTLLHKARPNQMENPLGVRVEDDLLNYEMQYWAGYDLPGPPKVKVLSRCVAAAMLCGATDQEEARALLALRDVTPRDRDVIADWLHGLYPVPSGRYWGYLQPDRVGEHLIRRVANSEPDFLEDVSQAASADQRSHAITVYARIGARLEEVEILPEAREWYERAAATGHNDAAYKLAELWRKADKPAKAKKWYEQAATAGHNDAAFKLAELCREDGKPAKAKKWYEQAAVAGHNDAAFKLGQLLWQDGEPAQARKWFMRAAAADHLDAAYELGWLLREIEHDHAGAAFWWRMATEGNGGGRTDAAFELAKMLAQDGQPDEVRHWYQYAATFGHTEAAFKLGELLWADGQPDEAKPWYEQAAEGKHARAASQLGWLLLRHGDHAGAAYWWLQAAELAPLDTEVAAQLAGLLVRAGEPGQARPWYEQAIREGHRDASYELGELLWQDGHPDEASIFYERAANQGHARAAFQLGWLRHAAGDRDGATYWWRRAAELGEDQARPLDLAEQLWHLNDPAAAREWYEQAAREGHPQAACQLGWLLLRAERDRAGAAYWWGIAAGRGERAIMFDLAELLWQDGRPDEAQQWYEQAAGDGHAQAAYQLGWLLEGRGDHAGARHWWQLAADRGSLSAQRLLTSSAADSEPAA